MMTPLKLPVHNFQIPYGSCTVDEDGCLDEIHEKPSYHHLINTGFGTNELRCIKEYA